MRTSARAHGNLCVAIGGPTLAAALACLDRVRDRADMVELRLDLISDYDLPRLLQARPCPAIVTLRPVAQGGAYAGDEDHRLAELRRAAALGAEWVDVELEAAPSLGALAGARRIVSHHDFSGVPPEPERLLAALWQAGADAAKLAVMVERPAQVGRLLRLYDDAPAPSIILGMGPFGVASRLLGLRSPSCLLTFVADQPGGTAPGQVSLEEAEQVYRARALGRGTAAIGYLGPAEDRALLRAVNRALSSRACDAVAVPLGPLSAADGLAAVAELRLAGALVPPPLEAEVARLLPADGGAKGRANVVLYRADQLVAAWAPTPEAQLQLLAASLA